MPGDWGPALPQLNRENHAVTSPRTPRYNCIGWAAGSATKWWWPHEDYYWPESAAREETLESFVQAFETLGYRECQDGSLEQGLEKVVIYALKSAGERLFPTHAARQLANGAWTSKLGAAEDIEHLLPTDVNGPVYGEPARFLCRPRSYPSE